MKRALARVALGFAALLVLVLAYLGALSLVRGTPVTTVRSVGERQGPPPVTDPVFAKLVEALSGTEISGGNRVSVLLNGDETFPPLWRDLRGARRSITVQMYYAQPGAVADTLAVILRERARAGVRVLFLADAFGAQNLSEAYLDSLRAAGVQAARLRPLRWYRLDRAQHRAHVRAIVVDGVVGYTGGFGFDDKWLGEGRTPSEWRETNVRFEGPAVARLQAAFAAGWAEARGVLLTGDAFFPRAALQPEGGADAGLLYTAPDIGSTAAERFLTLSIAAARRQLWIANSYFVPDDDLVRLLARAARRGVDVRLLVPGDRTDVPVVRYAGRSAYEELLAAGVRIWEYQPAMMHAKTFVVDGVWSTVGGMNFDNRSLALNDEATLLVLNAEVGAHLAAAFQRDLRYAREIRLEGFRQRPWHQKVREWGSSLLSKFL